LKDNIPDFSKTVILNLFQDPLPACPAWPTIWVMDAETSSA
jgi:hypothetical protein